MGLLLHGLDEFGPDKAWGNARLVVHAVGSGEHVRSSAPGATGPVPHDIEAPLADVDGAIGAGHGIADQFLAFRKSEIERGEAAFDELGVA